jgi:hypothetical protein
MLALDAIRWVWTLFISSEALALAAKTPLEATMQTTMKRRRNPRLARRILTHLQRADANGDNDKEIGFSCFVLDPKKGYLETRDRDRQTLKARGASA